MSILAPSPKNHNTPRPLLARLIVFDYLIVVCVNFGASVSTCPPRPFQNEQQSTPLKNKHSKQEQEQFNTLGSRAAKGGEVSGNKLNKNVPTPFPFPNHNRSGQKRAATHPSQKQTIPSWQEHRQVDTLASRAVKRWGGKWQWIKKMLPLHFQTKTEAAENEQQSAPPRNKQSRPDKNSNSLIRLHWRPVAVIVCGLTPSSPNIAGGN